MSSTTASPSSPAGALARWKGRRQIERSSSRVGLWLLALGLLVFFELHVGGFITSSNLVQILQNVAPTLIAAIPAARLLITGNVDLSIAGGYAFMAVTLGQIMHHTPSPWLAVAIALALGGLLGLVNGLLVRWLKISPIIVTLALGTVYTSFAYLTTDGNPVYNLPESFPNWAQTKFIGVPMTVWVALVVFGLGSFHLSRTVSGLHSYAIGGSALAARFSGVRVDRHVLLLYVYMGVSVALLAAVTTGAIGSASPTNGVGFEIDVLTAVILGGVAFNGGAGRWSGVFIGVVVIGILQAGFVFEGLNSYYQLLAKGALLLFALGADQVVAQRRSRARVPGAAATAAVSAELVEDTPVLDRAPVSPGLQATHLAKSYGAIAAVRDVTFNAPRGEVTCLLGDNGAGKSTVIKMLSGVIQQDTGTITLEGEPVSFHEPAAAQQAGVHTVYQELALCTNLGAALNLVLGDEPRVKGFEWLDLLDRAESERRAKERMSALGVTLTDYFRPTGEMSGGQRQSVAISRVNVDDAKVVILDEPDRRPRRQADRQRAAPRPPARRQGRRGRDDHPRHRLGHAGRRPRRRPQPRPGHLRRRHHRGLGRPPHPPDGRLHREQRRRRGHPAGPGPHQLAATARTPLAPDVVALLDELNARAAPVGDDIPPEEQRAAFREFIAYLHPDPPQPFDGTITDHVVSHNDLDVPVRTYLPDRIHRRGRRRLLPRRRLGARRPRHLRPVRPVPRRRGRRQGRLGRLPARPRAPLPRRLRRLPRRCRARRPDRASPRWLALCGDSAGGNLAACVTGWAVDHGTRIDAQLLIYPVCDRTMSTPSYAEFADGYLLTRQGMEYFWRRTPAASTTTTPASSPARRSPSPTGHRPSSPPPATTPWPTRAARSHGS